MSLNTENNNTIPLRGPGGGLVTPRKVVGFNAASNGPLAPFFMGIQVQAANAAATAPKLNDRQVVLFDPDFAKQQVAKQQPAANAAATAPKLNDRQVVLFDPDFAKQQVPKQQPAANAAATAPKLNDRQVVLFDPDFAKQQVPKQQPAAKPPLSERIKPVLSKAAKRAAKYTLETSNHVLHIAVIEPAHRAFDAIALWHYRNHELADSSFRSDATPTFKEWNQGFLQREIERGRRDFANGDAPKQAQVVGVPHVPVNGIEHVNRAMNIGLAVVVDFIIPFQVMQVTREENLKRAAVTAIKVRQHFGVVDDELRTVCGAEPAELPSGFAHELYVGLILGSGAALAAGGKHFFPNAVSVLEISKFNIAYTTHDIARQALLSLLMCVPVERAILTSAPGKKAVSAVESAAEWTRLTVREYVVRPLIIHPIMVAISEDVHEGAGALTKTQEAQGLLARIRGEANQQMQAFVAQNYPSTDLRQLNRRLKEASGHLPNAKLSDFDYGSSFVQHNAEQSRAVREPIRKAWVAIETGACDAVISGTVSRVSNVVSVAFEMRYFQEMALAASGDITNSVTFGAGQLITMLNNSPGHDLGNYGLAVLQMGVYYWNPVIGTASGMVLSHGTNQTVGDVAARSAGAGVFLAGTFLLAGRMSPMLATGTAVALGWLTTRAAFHSGKFIGARGMQLAKIEAAERNIPLWYAEVAERKDHQETLEYNQTVQKLSARTGKSYPLLRVPKAKAGDDQPTTLRPGARRTASTLRYIGPIAILGYLFVDPTLKGPRSLFSGS